MKITVIIGVRPHFVKISALYPELIKQHSVTLINTGQHFDFEMAGIFFKDLEIPKPTYELGVGSGTHAQQTGMALVEIERILIENRPDCVLVIGDANSSMAGALASSKLGIPVGHIEAGACNHELNMPEEINRLVTDSISSFLFAPTERALQSLKERGLTRNSFLTGDLLLDCVIRNLDKAQCRLTSLMDHYQVEPYKYLVLTVHRASNTDNPTNLRDIMGAINSVERPIIFPVHPRTRKALLEADLIRTLEKNPNIRLTDPLSYLDLLALQSSALITVTDSNGIQRETFFLKRPCVILRKNTEYQETVDSGCAILAGTNPSLIIAAIEQNLQINNREFDLHLFGDGHAGKKIALSLANNLA